MFTESITVDTDHAPQLHEKILRTVSNPAIVVEILCQLLSRVEVRNETQQKATSLAHALLFRFAQDSNTAACPDSTSWHLLSCLRVPHGRCLLAAGPNH